MAESLAIVVRAAPFGSINAAEALRHATAGINFGVATTLILLEDGVYVAERIQEGERLGFTSLAEPLARYARQENMLADGSVIRGRVAVHEPSLLLRGLEPDRLIEGIEIVDDGGLAALFAGCDAVLSY